MPVFQYRGWDRTGDKISGKIKAVNLREAERKLNERKVAVRAISELEGILYKDIELLKTKVKNKDLMIFIRQFSTLIKAGISIVDCVKILSQQTDSKLLKTALIHIEERLSEGRPFSEAAEEHPYVFPPMFINMMKAAEAGGQMEEILDRLASYFEKQYQIKQKIKAAMSYPIVVGIVALITIVFLLSTVVPMFTSMFASFDAELPAITRFVIGSGDIVQAYWWLVFLLIAVLMGLYFFSLRFYKFSYWMDHMKLKIPIFGPLLKKAAIARMTRTLGSLFSASVPVVTALGIVNRILDNKVLSEVIEESIDSLKEGNSIAEPMRKHWAFPPLVSQMMSLGEKSGTLDYMLDKLADFYESEVEQTTDQIKSLIEPLLIVFLAVVVGTIVAAIAVPMFSILNEIR